GLVEIVVLAAGKAPRLGTGDGLAAFADEGGAAAAQSVDRDLVLAAHLLAGVAEDFRAVGVFIDDGEVVVDVAELGTGADLPAAHAVAAHRILVAQGPGADVEVVDVLLDVEIARQPGEVIPVAHLPFHVGPVFLPRKHPDAATQVVRLQGTDVPDGAVVQPAHYFPISV